MKFCALMEGSVNVVLCIDEVLCVDAGALVFIILI